PPAPPRHDALAVGARPHRGRAPPPPLVLLADMLGALQRPPRLDDLLLGNAGIQRQRHRYLNHVDRLDYRAALALLRVLGGKPAGRPDDVVVHLLTEDRDEDRAVLNLGNIAQRLRRNLIALGKRLALDPAIDDV